MTSYETVKFLADFVTLTDKPNLAGLLSTIESIYLTVTKVMREAIVESDHNKAGSIIANLKHNLENAYALNLKKTSSRMVYSEVEQIFSGLTSMNTAYGTSIANLESLINQVSNFVELYEAFIHDSSRENTFNLIHSGQELNKLLDSYVGMSLMLKNILEPTESLPSEGYEELSLLLAYEPSYKALLIKLTALHELYFELCNLIGVSAAEYPLQISKLESGSLWVKIFGESKVIALLTRLIESGAGYLYRRFTTEGKVASIPKQVESVESLLRLSGNLEQMGVDTTEMKENLRKSGVVISSRLNDLLIGSPSIKINEQNYSVGDTLTEKYLSESRTLLLGEGKESGEEL